MIRHVAGVGEIVEDVAAAVAFYRDVLGLEVEYDGDGAYAEVKVAGIAHYGLWGRRAAAESILGDASLADRVPLGFAMGFEVDSVEDAATTTGERGLPLIQSPKTEPWGQVVARFILPSGLVGEFAETPWARQLGE
jgi:catechol 2,3-dioxygenase-like lactoylglutathione lyase family enzyme